MTYRFDASADLIVVAARLFGPTGDLIVRLALDTGATTSLINTEILVLLGYDPAASSDRIQVTTGSGVEFCPRVIVKSIDALGHSRTNFPILCHTLPPTSQVDGLLGLDFFRGCKLEIDLKNGTINVS